MMSVLDSPEAAQVLSRLDASRMFIVITSFKVTAR